MSTYWILTEGAALTVAGLSWTWTGLISESLISESYLACYANNFSSFFLSCKMIYSNFSLLSCLLESVGGAGLVVTGAGGGTWAWDLRLMWATFFIIYSMLKSLESRGFTGADTFAEAG